MGDNRFMGFNVICSNRMPKGTIIFSKDIYDKIIQEKEADDVISKFSCLAGKIKTRINTNPIIDDKMKV